MGTHSNGIGMKESWHGFVFGGVASCISQILTCPMDVVKVRMQLQGQGATSSLYNGTISTSMHIFRQEGPTALFKVSVSSSRELIETQLLVCA